MKRMYITLLLAMGSCMPQALAQKNIYAAMTKAEGSKSVTMTSIEHKDRESRKLEQAMKNMKIQNDPALIKTILSAFQKDKADAYMVNESVRNGEYIPTMYRFYKDGQEITCVFRMEGTGNATLTYILRPEEGAREMKLMELGSWQEGLRSGRGEFYAARESGYAEREHIRAAQAAQREKFREAQVVRQEKLKEAQIARQEKLREAEVTRQEALRQAQVARQEKLKEAQIARQEKLREAEVVRQEALRRAKALQLEKARAEREVNRAARQQIRSQKEAARATGDISYAGHVASDVLLADLS